MMFHDLSTWKLVYWLLGTIGVAGTIMVGVLFPVAFRAVAGFFTLVLSYRAGCALLAAIAAAIVTGYWQHSRDDAKFAERTAAFERQQVERDARIERETRDAVWTDIANATAENAVTDTEVKDFTNALPKADDLFRVGDAACSLRRIAGQAPCGPDESKGVSETDARNEGVVDHKKLRLPGSIRGIARHHQQGQQSPHAPGQLR